MVKFTFWMHTISPWVFFIFFRSLAKYQNLDFAVHWSGAKIRIWYIGGVLFLSVGIARPMTLYSVSLNKKNVDALTQLENFIQSLYIFLVASNFAKNFK